MSTLGNRLRSTRMGKGMSLEQLSESTKISVTSLECIENNDFSDLPEIIIRGFLRSICQVLKLDEEKFLAEFSSLRASVGPAAPARRPSKPLAVKPKHGRLRLIVALIVFLALGSLLLLVVFKPATMRGAGYPLGAPSAPAAVENAPQR